MTFRFTSFPMLKTYINLFVSSYCYRIFQGIYLTGIKHLSIRQDMQNTATVAETSFGISKRMVNYILLVLMPEIMKRISVCNGCSVKSWAFCNWDLKM